MFRGSPHIQTCVFRIRGKVAHPFDHDRDKRIKRLPLKNFHGYYSFSDGYLNTMVCPDLSKWFICLPKCAEGDQPCPLFSEGEGQEQACIN